MWDLYKSYLISAGKALVTDVLTKWNALCTFKTMNNLVPGYISEKFTLANTIHHHNLRGSNHNLFVPRPNTEALKKSFSYRGAVLWNDLTPQAKQATSLAAFKTHLQ